MFEVKADKKQATDLKQQQVGQHKVISRAHTRSVTAGLRRRRLSWLRRVPSSAAEGDPAPLPAPPPGGSHLDAHVTLY